MGFVGVYTALYDYHPQSKGELELHEGDLLYVLEKSEEDDWWKAKKRAERDDDDEPEGLVPNNYIEEVRMNSTLFLRWRNNARYSCTSGTTATLFLCSFFAWPLVPTVALDIPTSTACPRRGHAGYDRSC